MKELSTEILIIGAGPAGLAAARAASRNAKVTLLDDNPDVGGQIWRAEAGKRGDPRLESPSNVKVINNAVVHGGEDARVFAATDQGPQEIEFEKLILATGARERFLPFPGWTLPNVMGAGGLQALVKGGLQIQGKRVVVAGTGPLLIAVAEYLKRKGAQISAIVEQADISNLARFSLRLARSPQKLKQAFSLKAGLRGVPYLTGGWITSAFGDDRLRSVRLHRRGKSWDVECDFLACGFHLVPNLELPKLFGCTTEDGYVSVDDRQLTSVSNIYCAGEVTGIAGVDSAVVEGGIAGLAATGRVSDAKQLFPKRDRGRRFGTAMDTAFKLRDELRSLPNAETIVCRCEDVRFGRLEEFAGFREAKLQTRCGMGPCQGRICGTAGQFLFGWEPPSVRPPIFPVRMENI
jgi:NADPH-dependent 2,4-dienoyl-CoA reductase/sulfur reductase-like enzyme